MERLEVTTGVAQWSEGGGGGSEHVTFIILLKVHWSNNKVVKNTGCKTLHPTMGVNSVIKKNKQFTSFTENNEAHLFPN